MTKPEEPAPQVVPPRPGLGHLIDATGYSLSGMGRLWRETAARQELILGAVALGLLALFGASVAQFLGFGVLFALLLAVEALNTAIEVLTDRISPEWSRAAKDAKDLGSLAVGLMVLCNVGFVAAVGLGLV
ncbi:diacylglycerol kinase [Rhodobacter capsulatus]|uniref:diacylglycerol kinase n=1 Tax=Rhodobacter capsulatus TaxID=1061 RepID=UPI0003D35579|nr:diacylglycerol kinase [Rhodobacter capsulatus]ETD83450.1 diacylglycerol kinase [Rhodobacter capsulatus YW1]